MNKITDSYKRLQAVIKDVNGDNHQIIKSLQYQIDYLMVEGCDVLRKNVFLHPPGNFPKFKNRIVQRRTTFLNSARFLLYN